jgi:VanZ family protein
MFQQLARRFFDDAYRAMRFRTAFVLYFLIIGFGSIPGARAELGQVAPGLVLHVLAYSIITVLLFTGSGSRPFVKALQSCLIVAVMGMLDEYVQSFFPYREATVRDWAIDVAASFGTVCWLWTRDLKRASKVPMRHDNPSGFQ